MNAAALRRAWAARWGSLGARERLAVGVAGAIALAAALWAFALAPALRTVRAAPAQLEALDIQLAAMRRLAAEARELRATPALPPAQARAALEASAQRLGDRARLTVQGDRAHVDLNGLSGDALGAWLAEVRLAARTQVTDAQLLRTPEGVSRGRLVLALSRTDGTVPGPATAPAARGGRP